MVSPELLRRFPYFAPIEEESLRQIAMIAKEVVVPASTTLFDEHDPADRMYLMVDGEVQLQYMLGSGELRTVDTVGNGELLVWSALVEPYRCTGIGTTTRESRLVAFDAVALRQLCQDRPELCVRLMTQITKLVANRLEAARVQLAAV